MVLALIIYQNTFTQRCQSFLHVLFFMILKIEVRLMF